MSCGSVGLLMTDLKGHDGMYNPLTINLHLSERLPDDVSPLDVQRVWYCAILMCEGLVRRSFIARNRKR